MPSSLLISGLVLLASCSQEQSPTHPSTAAMQATGDNEGDTLPILDHHLWEENELDTSAGPQEISLQWPANKRFVYQASSEQTTATEDSPLMTMVQSEASQIFTYAIEPQQVDEQGHQVIEITYLSAKVDLDMVGNQIHYDSDQNQTQQETDPSTETAFKGMSKLMGHSMRVTLNQAGEILQVDGLDKLYQTLRESMPGQSNAIYERLIQEDQIRNLIRYPFLPPVPVTPGTPWQMQSTENTTLGQFASISNHYTYAGTLERDGANLHAISVKGMVEPYADEDPDPMGLSMQGGSSQGNILLSTGFGYLMESTSNQTLSMRIQLPEELMASLPVTPELTFKIMHHTQLLEISETANKL